MNITVKETAVLLYFIENNQYKMPLALQAGYSSLRKKALESEQTIRRLAQQAEAMTDRAKYAYHARQSGFTLQELATELNISTARVRQIIAKYERKING